MSKKNLTNHEHDMKSNFSNNAFLFFNIVLFCLFCLIATNDARFVNIEYDFKIFYFLSTAIFIYFLILLIHEFLLQENADNEIESLIFVIVLSIVLFLPNILLPTLQLTFDLINLNRILFWSSIILWTLSLMFVFKYFQDKNTKSNKSEKINFITFLSLFWFFLSFYITVGTEIYNFAEKPINDFASLDKIADIRVIVGLLIVTFIVCKSIITSLNTPLIQIETLKISKIPYISNNIILRLFFPIIFILNTIIMGFSLFLNVLWKCLATVTFYSAIFFKNLFIEFYSQYFKFNYVRLIMVCMLIYSFFLTSSFIIDSNPVLLSYLNAKTIYVELSLFYSIFIIFIKLIFLLYFQLLFYKILNSYNGNSILDFGVNFFNAASVSIQIIFSKSLYALSVFCVAGFVIYGLAKLKTLNIRNFDHIGLFTLCMSIFIVIVGIIYTIFSFLNKKNETK